MSTDDPVANGRRREELDRLAAIYEARLAPVTREEYDKMFTGFCRLIDRVEVLEAKLNRTALLQDSDFTKVL